VLEEFFRRYVSLNSFTRTTLKTMDRGEVMRWPARLGQRQIL
jgi:type VI secretion system protein ImpG